MPQTRSGRRSTAKSLDSDSDREVEVESEEEVQVSVSTPHEPLKKRQMKPPKPEMNESSDDNDDDLPLEVHTTREADRASAPGTSQKRRRKRVRREMPDLGILEKVEATREGREALATSFAEIESDEEEEIIQNSSIIHRKKPVKPKLTAATSSALAFAEQHLNGTRKRVSLSKHISQKRKSKPAICFSSKPRRKLASVS